MFEGIKHIFDIIFDNSKSWGKKTSFIITLIFALILFDFVFNISFNIFNENKLVQLEKVNILKKDYENDDKRLKEIYKIENQIFTKEHYSDFVIRNFADLTKNEKIDKNTSEPKNNSKLSLFWMIISSNTFLVFVVFIMFLLPIFGGRESRQANFFIGIFASLFFIIITMSVVTFIAYQIPLQKNPTYNYLINFVIQTLIYTLIIWQINKRKKRQLT